MVYQEKTGEAKKRLQFEASLAEYEHLIWLMHVCGLATNKDLFNNALTMFEWAVREVGAGREVGSMDRQRNEFSTLSMPSLRSAAHNVPKYRDADTTSKSIEAVS